MTTPISRIFRNGHDVAEDWQIDEKTIYLNHGSYGPAPLPVREARRRWQDRLESQPMDFYSRHLEEEWFKARDLFAMFINAKPSDLTFVENATTGMNLVAHSFPLRPGDIVALTDHEYGAVRRIWQKACDNAGAQIFTVRFPEQLESEQHWVNAMIDPLPPQTRLIVVSHITSATALILPIGLLCREASKRGIPVCIDGPHAPLHVDIDMASIGCAFYAASCHKWLCAPFGSGFLWVNPDYQQTMRPLNISWGRHMPRLPETWVDQLVWTGTRDYSAFLSVPTAIDYFRELGMESVRQHNFALADYARKRLGEAFPGHPIAPLNQNWYGMMAHHPLPTGDARSLQTRLWEMHHIEVPIIAWQEKRYARVSCHLYNTHKQIDQFIGALEKLIYEE